jgi:hypothetical protein
VGVGFTDSEQGTSTLEFGIYDNSTFQEADAFDDDSPMYDTLGTSLTDAVAALARLIISYLVDAPTGVTDLTGSDTDRDNPAP